MSASHNPHAIPLDPRVTVTVARKKFLHPYTYQAPITTSMGHVSGGGTRGGTAVNTGFGLRITNHESDLRSYYFSVGIFTDHANKIMRQSIPRHVAHIHPGHTMEVDIELHHREDFAAAYLVDFVISQGSQTPLAHFTPDFPLALAAEPNGPPEDEVDLDVFYWLVTLELLFVCFCIGAVLAYHLKFSTLASWGWGIGCFFAGTFLLKHALGRGLLYGFFSFIWAILAYGKWGLLEAIGVGALAVFIHWWLRGAARAAQEKHQAARRYLSKRMK